MNAPSEDIKDMLVAESALALTYGTDLFIGREPSSPPNCVTIYDTPGTAKGLTLDGQAYGYPNVQILVRNQSYTAGWAIIDAIEATLHGRAHETWNGALYTVIRTTSGPSLLENDENGRAKLVLNLNVQRR
jgi:hypothetical protein